VFKAHPIIEELTAEYNGKVKFVKLNVLESSAYVTCIWKLAMLDKIYISKLLLEG